MPTPLLMLVMHSTNSRPKKPSSRPHRRPSSAFAPSMCDPSTTARSTRRASRMERVCWTRASAQSTRAISATGRSTATVSRCSSARHTLASSSTTSRAGMVYTRVRLRRSTWVSGLSPLAMAWACAWSPMRSSCSVSLWTTSSMLRCRYPGEASRNTCKERSWLSGAR